MLDMSRDDCNCHHLCGTLGRERWRPQEFLLGDHGNLVFRLPHTRDRRAEGWLPPRTTSYSPPFRPQLWSERYSALCLHSGISAGVTRLSSAICLHEISLFCPS